MVSPKDDHLLQHLFVKIATKDSQAMLLFYRKTRHRIYSQAKRIVRQHESAEEVMDDVYMQVWCQAGRYDPALCRPWTWLRTLCRCRAVDYLRKTDKLQYTEMEAWESDPLLYDDRDPQTIALNNEWRLAFMQVLETMEFRHRQLLAMTFIKGLTHTEIARHSGLPLGTVKSCIREGMQKLRQGVVRIYPQ